MNQWLTISGDSQLSMTLVSTYRKLLLDEIQKSTHCVKSFDPDTQTLTVFCWHVSLLCITPSSSSLLKSNIQLHRPTHEQPEACIVPSVLHKYHQNHQFLGLCCSCLLLVLQSEGLDFIEAAIYVPSSGPCAGECIAQCVRSQCDYLGP